MSNALILSGIRVRPLCRMAETSPGRVMETSPHVVTIKRIESIHGLPDHIVNTLNDAQLTAAFSHAIEDKDRIRVNLILSRLSRSEIMVCRYNQHFTGIGISEYHFMYIDFKHGE